MHQTRSCLFRKCSVLWLEWAEGKFHVQSLVGCSYEMRLVMYAGSCRDPAEVQTRPLYSLFVAAYLIVLYLQASAYNSGEVVSTLRNALMPCEARHRLLVCWQCQPAAFSRCFLCYTVVISGPCIAQDAHISGACTSSQDAAEYVSICMSKEPHLQILYSIHMPST